MKLLGMSVFKTDDIDTMFHGVLNKWSADDESDSNLDEDEKKIKKLI